MLPHLPHCPTRRPALLAVLCLLPLGLVSAQQVTPAAAANADDRAPVKIEAAAPTDVVELTPFQVTSAGDRGYQAQSSLGGSRLKTDLKNIASPTSAFTAQFLQDTAITNSDDLAKYMLSTEYDLGEDSGGQNRLAPSNKPLRMRGLAGGSYAVNFFKNDLRTDTFSLSRIDQSRGPNSVLFGVGSPGGIINVTTKRAILGATKTALTVQGTTWDGLRWEGDFNVPVGDKIALRVAAVNTVEGSWRNYEYDDQQRYFGTAKWVIGKKTELNVEGERGNLNKATKRTIVGYDAYSNWVAAGRNLNTAANTAQQVQRIAGTNVPWIVFDSTGGTIANWVNKTSSQLRQSADAEPSPITDFSIVPRESIFYGPGYNQGTDYTRLSAYLTHSFTPDFNVEVAGMRMNRAGQVWDAQGPAQEYLKIDTNATLPNGAVNPHAGQPYLEALTQVNNTSTRDDAIRTIASYTKGRGSFWGKHTLAGVFEADWGKTDQAITRESVISANAPNTATPDNNNNRVNRRTYVTLGGPSSDIVLANFQNLPISGLVDSATGIPYTTAFIPFNANTQLNSYKSTSAIGMLQSAFWHDRIHTVVGGSYDERSDFLGSQVRVPYTNFSGGIIQPVRGHVANKSHANSFSFSGVLQVTDWLGLTYSKAENSALPNSSGRISSADGLTQGMRPPTPRGKSQDMGIKLDLWKHKVFLTALYYETSDVNDFDFTPVIAPTINPIWAGLNLAGVPVPAGYTYDPIITTGGTPTIADITTGATFAGKSHGVELELTANPTDHWRIFANASSGVNTHANIGPEERAYVAKWRPFWLANSAVAVSGTGTAGTVGGQVALVDAALLANYVLPDGKEPLGQMKYKATLRTSYDFSAGWARGVTVGGGIRYNSAPVVGYFTSFDSSNNVVARVIRGSDQIFFDANVSYRRKLNLLRKSCMWTLQLNVNNVLNNDAFVRLRVSSINEVELYKFNPPRELLFSSKFEF